MKVRRIVTAAAALATCGVLGMAAPNARASSVLAATWTQQQPATSPPARYGAAMAYDPATRTEVLFGGLGSQGVSRATWTWDGTTWTRQHPASSPPAQYSASMAYDPATRTVVLLGSRGGTWTWDGTTWTQQHPATRPPARTVASMAYDPATGTVVLFGGAVVTHGSQRDDTWTWDGTTWTQQHPAASPSARWGAAMAYDSATGTVVLFGGASYAIRGEEFADTWTWG